MEVRSLWLGSASQWEGLERQVEVADDRVVDDWTQVLWIWTSGAAHRTRIRREEIGSTPRRMLPRCPVGNYTTRQQEEGELAVRPEQVSQR